MTCFFKSPQSKIVKLLLFKLLILLSQKFSCAQVALKFVGGNWKKKPHSSYDYTLAASLSYKQFLVEYKLLIAHIDNRNNFFYFELLSRYYHRYTKWLSPYCYFHLTVIFNMERND